MRSIVCCVWLLLFLNYTQATGETTTEIPADQLPLEARSADFSGEDDVISTSYVLPNQIFNDGKAYYPRQDPISGQLDFSAKKPAGIEPDDNEVVDPKEKIFLNAGTPNIHDYLNLPVKYSSSKFVYPLVSSSYANLKYQGSNKNYIANKNPSTSHVAAVTTPASYLSTSYYTIPTTKLTAVPPTEVYYQHSFPSTTPRTSTTSTTRMTTTRKLTTKAVTTTTTLRPKLASTTNTPLTTRTSTTRKKFMPTRRTTTTIPTKSTTEPAKETTTKSAPTKNNTFSDFTTHHPTPQAAIFPTEKATTAKMYSTTTRAPFVFTEESTITPTTSTLIPNLDPADVYHTIGQKHNQEQQQQQQQQTHATEKPFMSLGDIFDNLAEEESAVALNYQQNQGFDAQGNLIEPIAFSKPSPFAMQKTQPPKLQNAAAVPTATYTTKLPQYLQEQKPDMSHNNEYVSYQVQQPNIMQYRPGLGQVNNVVISPEQQSASFVLGSQQQVSQHSMENLAYHGKDTPGVQYGHVINEDIANIKRPQQVNYSADLQVVVPPGNKEAKLHTKLPQSENFAATGAPATANFNNYPNAPPEPPSPYQQLPLIDQRPAASRPKVPEQHTAQSEQMPQQSPINLQDTKDLLLSTNIRFPANDEESLKLSSSLGLSLPPAGPHINGHAQPLSLQQIHNANSVVFPKDKEEAGSNAANNPNVQIQQHDVVTMMQHKQQLQFPNKPLTVTPSQNMEPPPRYPTNPPTQTPHGSPQPYRDYQEFNRKAYSDTNNRLNNNLPNILPQFRPNAKVSKGHPSNYKQEAGNIRLPTPPGLKRPYMPTRSGQFAHRRQPLQSHYPMNRILEYPVNLPASAVDVNRRIYRMPAPGPQPMQHYLRRPQSPPRGIDNYPVERHAPIPTMPQKTKPAESFDDFEEEDLVINDPPQPVANSLDRKGSERIELEPVVTLQMLQSQKKPLSLPSDDTGAGEIQVTEEIEAQQTEQDKRYAYEGTIAKHSDALANAHAEMPSGSEYQNTPFSVTRDEPQEPILKNKKPTTLQQPTKKQQPSKDKFPYPIEKPDESYTRAQPKAPLPGVLITTRLLNGALGSSTDAPIAIAYSPTEPYPHQQHAQKYSNVNVAAPVINEIRTGTQTEESLNSDLDFRGQNLEKDFMAPFYPSVSLDTSSDVTSAVTPLNSWNILSTTTEQQIYEKHAINRADVLPDEEINIMNESSSTVRPTNQTGELNGFQPQYQTGFKPIYPPGYQHVETVEERNLGTETKALHAENNSISSSTSTTTTTAPPSKNTEDYAAANSTMDSEAVKAVT